MLDAGYQIPDAGLPLFRRNAFDAGILDKYSDKRRE
jgi:hypothetical protein